MGELKYRKAFDTLRSEILSGKYASWKSFPSIVATCTRFKISRLTAVKAFDKLKEEGLISTRVGAGTFVTKDARSRFIGLVVPGISYSSEPKFGSRGFQYCRIANEPVTFPVAGFVRSGT